jgi:CHAT domain-containing protein
MSDGPFFDVDLLFDALGELYEPRVRSVDGEKTGMPFSGRDLHFGGSGRLWRSDRRDLGSQLYEAAFSDRAREVFERARALAAEQRRQLRLRLHLSSELADLPWEYLYDAAGQTFLSLEGPVVRILDLPMPHGERLSGSPLRVLAVLPSREDQGVAEALGDALEGLVKDGKVVLDRLPWQNRSALQERLSQGDYDVVHLTGRPGRLALEPPELSPKSVRLAVLQTEDEPAGAALSEAAESLIRRGFTSVVASPLPAGHGAARFANRFYRSLAAGAAVELAVAEGRRALYSQPGEELDWGAPVVYTRAAGVALLGALVQPSLGKEPEFNETSTYPQVLAKLTHRPPSRSLQGRFPERVRRGDTVTLLARIALDSAGEVSARLKDVEVPPEGLAASLHVYAPGFEIQGADRRPVTIPAAADSDWVPFDLKAVRPDVHSLEVSAFVGAFYLGSLTLQTMVDHTVSTSESQERRQTLRRPRLEGEVTLRIRYDTDAKVYRFQLIDESPFVRDEIPSGRLQQTPVAAINSLVQELNEIARGRSPFRSKKQTISWLKGKGIQLWQQFIPEELQRQFWDLHGRIRRILILSDVKGDPVPWELLYPFRPGGDGDRGFLADRFLISRWITPAEPPVSGLRLASAEFVEPPDDKALSGARAEIEAIRQLLGKHGTRTGEPIESLNLLTDLLRDGNFDLLHFACHNTYAPLEIRIGGEPFQPTLLLEHQGRFAASAPLVFINACRSDAQIPQYTELDGWARAFLNTGAGAFLGTLWEVRDETASLFAQEFYSTLCKPSTVPRTLGDALQAARSKIREYPGDPTWLAYTLYGDTAATLIASNP